MKFDFNQGYMESYPLWEATLGRYWKIHHERYKEILLQRRHVSVMHEGRFVGFMAYDINSITNQGSIELIVIHPDYQRKKIGTQLLQRAKNELRLLGVTKVTIAGADQNCIWRALPNNLNGVDVFFKNNGWDLNAASPDQFAAIENYKSPAFLNVKHRRKGLQFRFYESSDRKCLLDLQQSNFPHWYIYYEQFINSGRNENIIVAYVGNQLVGSCLLEYPNEKFMGSNWVKHFGSDCGSPSVLGVDERYRGYEIGYYLFDHAIKTLVKAGAKHAFINASDAVSIYRRFGFEILWEYKQGFCFLS